MINIFPRFDPVRAARTRDPQGGVVAGIDLTTITGAPMFIAPKKSDSGVQAAPSSDHVPPRAEQSWTGSHGSAGMGLAAIAEQLVAKAVAIGASDIHVTPCTNRVLVRMRVDGAMLDVLELPVTSGRQLIHHFKVMAGMDPSRTFIPTDGRQTRYVNGHEVDIRLACAPCVAGENLAVRLLSRQRLKRTIDDLGLSEPDRSPIEKWLNGNAGMLLAAGPTGSGKTTTLCAMLHELKMTGRRVVTIEDPVEYQIDGVAQMQVDERHGLTFAEGLRAMLRLDADYLLIGEIRDSETAQVALEASTSGRRLMSTLHSCDAFGVITALRNWGMADNEITTSLSMVIGQRLLRKLCPHCRRRAAPAETTVQWLTTLGLPVPKYVWHPTGCSECHQIGYSGRTGLFEVWSLEEEAYQLIREHARESTLRESMVAKGHRPLILEGISMAAEGIISFDELRSLGAFFIPAPSTPADELLQETLNCRSAGAAAFHSDELSNVVPPVIMSTGPSDPMSVL